ncbi:hypothetical protein [Actinokineospora enzanensis]|uniref:hypothetical protein n=1 Tax=Actinokineospora enzanensis TaxID=155975 RepID=UPI00035C86E0|nr:hypothetical protein [Actinokineospora enzanensis]
MPDPDDFDLTALIRQVAAGHDGVHVVDVADLGGLPPEMRKAAHTLGAVNALINYRQQLIEAADVYLARRIATQLAETPPDEGGGADLSLDSTARKLATDADLNAWKELSPNGLRDILTLSAQWLATTQHRYLPDAPETRAEVAGMLGDKYSLDLWKLADEELTNAGDAYDQAQMIPDNPEQPPLSTSPTNQAAAEIVAAADVLDVLVTAAFLHMAGRALELNATEAWNEFLQALLQ